MSAQGSQQSSTTSTFLNQRYGREFGNLMDAAAPFLNPGGAQGAATQAASFTNPFLQGAIGNVAGLGDSQAQINAQTDSLSAGLGDLFRNELMPGIRGNAIAAGGLGGGRQGVAEANAVGEIANAFTQGRGDIVARANQQALQANSLLPTLAQGYGQNMMAPMMAPFDILGAFSNILGSPIMESRGRSSRQSFGFGYDIPE